MDRFEKIPACGTSFKSGGYRSEDYYPLLSFRAGEIPNILRRAQVLPEEQEIVLLSDGIIVVDEKNPIAHLLQGEKIDKVLCG